MTQEAISAGNWMNGTCSPGFITLLVGAGIYDQSLNTYHSFKVCDALVASRDWGVVVFSKLVIAIVFSIIYELFCRMLITR